MKPPPPYATANAFTVKIQATELPTPAISVAAGLHAEPDKTLTLAPAISVDQTGPGGIMFSVKKFRQPAGSARADSNEFVGGKILAGDPDPKDGKYRKAWVLLVGHGEPRLVRLSVIERDGTSELPLQLVVTQDYATHFCSIRTDKGKLLGVLFAAASRAEHGDALEIRLAPASALIAARHQALRATRLDLIDRSSSSTT